MKYLIIKNKTEEEIVFQVSDFLWNNGHEVYFTHHLKNDLKIDGQDALDYCDCVVLFKFNKSSKEKEDLFHRKDFELSSKHKKLIVLLFDTDGVYTNAIPYPHKIYEYESLDKNSLINFQHWSKRLKIFS